MNLYEFIQPSDAITFRASTDKVAYYCALLLGGGKAGIRRADGKEVESPLLFLNSNAVEVAESYLGATISAFGKKNARDVVSCFRSFRYGSIDEAQTYEDAISAITDPEKLKDFKDKHEDRNRTSMSRWVKGAWDYADQYETKFLTTST